MTVPASGNIVQVTVRRLIDSQMVENVLHFRERTGLSTDEQIDASVEAFRKLVRSVTSPDIDFIDTMWKYTTPVPLDGRTVAPEAGYVHGGGDGSPLNTTLAIIVTLRTGTAGKRHRGRMYLPGTTAYVNRDVLSGAGITAMADFCTAVMAQFSDATGSDEHLALGIYSRLIGGTAPPTVAGWQAVSGMFPQNIIGNQRRRRVGVGI